MSLSAKRPVAPPPAARASAPPRSSAALDWLVPIALLLAVNLAVRVLVNPIHQLLFYCGCLGVLLLIERLRVGLPRAQALMLIVAGLYVGLHHRAELRTGKLEPGDAAEETIHLATGLGGNVAEALRVGALGESGLGAFARYADKVDPRSSEIDILASHLASQCEGADHLCESAAILRFVADEVTYRQDPRGGEDYIKTPQETLAANAGDCEDKSILLVSLLESLGNRTWLVFTRDHVWPLVCFDQPLPDLWTSLSRHRSAAWRTRYMEAASPHHDAQEFQRLIDAAGEVEIDGRSCYAVEPTAPGTFFGATHQTREYLVAVDPIARKMIDLEKATETTAPAE